MSIYNFTIENGIATMVFTPSDRYPTDLVESSFNREKEYLLRLQKFPWAPELVEINPSTKTISFKWYDNPLPNNWKEQLEQIVKDLHTENIFKPSFYQKYFYVDNNGILKPYNFYTAFDYKENPVQVDFYRPILNEDREELIDKIAPTGYLDLNLLTFHAYTNYIEWPEGALKDIYYKVYGLTQHPTICIIPFFHVSTTNDGNFRACCVSEDVIVPKEDGTPFNVRQDSIVDAWNSKQYRELRLDLIKGHKNPTCEYCWNYECSGAFSKRQKTIVENTPMYPDIKPLIDQALANDGAIESLPVDYDIKVGTQCNLKCIMCYPGSSSLHQEERDQIEAMGVELPGLLKFQDQRVKTFNLKVEDFNPRDLDIDNIVRNLDPGLQNAVQLGLVGGEPLANKTTQRLLEQCVEKGYAKNMHLEVITNLSVINQKLLGLFNEFKHPMLQISYDHIDPEKFYFIRYPADYSVFEKNLKEIWKYTHIQKKLSTTWSIFNIFDLESIFTRWEEMAHTLEGPLVINFGLVYYPNYFNLRYLEQDQKDLVTEQIQDFMSRTKDWKIFHNNSTFVDAVVSVPGYMGGVQPDHEEVCRERTRVLDLYDSIRGTNHKELFPYLKRYV